MRKHDWAVALQTVAPDSANAESYPAAMLSQIVQ
jgi:hypothetical protein